MPLVDIDTQVQDLPDAYTRLVEILNRPGLRGRIKDATMRALTATAEVVYSEAQPAATAAGDPVVAGSGYGSPWVWRVERIWLRELVAAGGSKVSFGGVIDAEAGSA